MIPNIPVPCATAPKLFTAAENERPDSPAQLSRIAQAKQVCFRCPIRIECLLDARETGAEGVRGGEDDRERAEANGQTYTPPRQPRELAECGTKAARDRHKRNGEPCWTCDEAARARAAEGRAKARATRARNASQPRAVDLAA